MTIKDIEFKLKDGRTAILRSANEKDAKAFIEYMKSQPVKRISYLGHRKNVRHRPSSRRLISSITAIRQMHRQ